MSSTIAWLHLSDWHQRGTDFGRQVIRDALIEDIQARSERDLLLERINFVVFSGDIAWSGQPAEFESAKTHLFDPVLKAVKLTPDRLFFVPGNHDLDRNTIVEMLPPALQRPLMNETEVQRWLTDERRRRRVLEPFEAYEAFISTYTGQQQPAYASLRSLGLEKSVALLGLNSAWMCARNEAAGKINDYGFLAIGEPQIHDALAKIKDHDLRIVVVHHAFTWLSEVRPEPD